MAKKDIFICEIDIIIILICQKLGLFGPVQQKIKLLSPNKEKGVLGERTDFNKSCMKPLQ